jgi:putative transposase
MGMQVSCSFHPEVSAQGDVRVDTQRARNYHSGVSAAQREQGGGGASDGGSCAYHADDPAEVLGSGVVGYIKGKSAIAIARRYMERKRNFVGMNFWARGYYVSTVGKDEAQVRNYIREQDKEDRRLDQLKTFE